jgi:hypothetical protein
MGHTATTTEDRETLQLALDNLCDWSERLGMAFNVKKCKVMHLGFNNPGQVYTMRGQALEEMPPPHGLHGKKETRQSWRRSKGGPSA